MNQLLTQSTNQGASRWLKLGLCSMALGVSSLFLASGSALATSVTDSYTLYNGVGDSFVQHAEPNRNLADSGDFYLHDINGINVGNGVNEWTFGKFDLSGTDWSLYSITSAKLTLTLLPKHHGIDSDEILLGNVFDFSTYILTDQVLLPDLFDSSKVDNFGVPEPTLGTEVTFTIDLLDGISKSAFTSILNGGDTGTLWMKHSDDSIVRMASLEVTAVQNPEPASLILLGTGLVGLAAWRCRKEKKA